jgi:translation initiation factor 3 subunit M
VLLLAVANLFQAAGPSAARDHFAFLCKYLATLQVTPLRNPATRDCPLQASLRCVRCRLSGVAPQAGDAELMSDTAREAVVRAAVEFIGAADLFQCDLLDLPAVAAYVNHPTAGAVLALLGTMLTGKLADLTALTAANPKLLQSLNLSVDAVMTKMRLLSLAALGAEADAGEVPYATIKATLQLQEGEVEGWVVKAIGLKLLEAKMDQLREVVVFSRCTQRVFADAQWLELRAKLSAWKENLGGICSMVQHTRLNGPTHLAGSQEAMPLPLR